MSLSEHRKEVVKRYLNSDKGRAKARRKYRKRTEQNKAKDAVNWLVRSGKIPRARDVACEDCGHKAIHYITTNLTPRRID